MQKKINKMVDKILEWWEEHKYDTYNDGTYNVYNDEPEFVTIAKELKK